ncbi:MAG: RibD family protein [Candidatus Kariarchaeaceae archaeon]|jgi:2,5-diamino-6-(ribosylamino)-4(3H)-pyrimidinone 5'-phosphate reductase
MKKREWFINAAISFDGKISGYAQQIELSSDEDWKVVHTYRNSIAAIVVGSNTIKIDNPSLMTKAKYLSHDTSIHHPVRVVLDRSGTCDPKSKVFQDQDQVPTIWVTTSPSEIIKIEKIQARKIEQIMQEVNSFCNNRGIEGNVMIEGGSNVINNFITSGLIKKIRLYRASLILPNGQPLFPSDISRKLVLKSVKKLGPGIEEIYEIQ